MSLPPNVTAGDTWNGTPLHVTVLNTPISGVGFNVTITWKESPAQVPISEVGNTV